MSFGFITVAKSRRGLTAVRGTFLRLLTYARCSPEKELRFLLRVACAKADGAENDAQVVMCM
jgi:hypothetical protein